LLIENQKMLSLMRNKDKKFVFLLLQIFPPD